MLRRNCFYTPASGSVYTYSYATIGEFVAHLVGWSLLLIYIVATAAVAAGWTGYFHNLIKGFGLEIPKGSSNDSFAWWYCESTSSNYYIDIGMDVISWYEGK